MILFSNKAAGDYEKLAYDFNFINIEGEELQMSEFKNKVIVVVNVASKCGFTSQYEDMQKIWDKYKDKEFVLLGIPSNDFGGQEPGENSQIKNFCETKFGITFPMTEKVIVKGKDAHPFYKWALKNHGKSTIPKWNFHKIIIGRDGKVSNTFASFTKPMSKKFLESIEKEIKN